MTSRIEAVMALGYTPAQAAFLELAALASGYYLRGQYHEFIQRSSGAMGQVFIERVLEKRHAECFATFGCRRLYHTNGQALFRALGDVNNRNRRAHKFATIRRRLMTLDYCLASPRSAWLLTESEKTHFFLNHGVAQLQLPSEQFGGAVRYFVDKQPIAV